MSLKQKTDARTGITTVREFTADEIAARQRSIVGLAPTATDAELAAAQVEVATKAARAAAIAGIYEPVAYGGKEYPVDTESMAKYELAKQSRTRGKLTKGIAIATDGSVLKLSTPQAIDAFHGAMEDAITARIAAVHDAI